MVNCKKEESAFSLSPSFIELETSSFCNRRCSWCPNSQYKRGQAKKFISFGLFSKIINDLREINYGGQLALHGYNEPLLDSRIYKFLRVIKKKLPKAKTIIFTNGDYLNQENLKILVESGISEIYVSLHDAIGKTDYKRVIDRNLEKLEIKQDKLKKISDVFGAKYTVNIRGLQVIYYIPYCRMLTSRAGIVKSLEKRNKNTFCYLPFASSAIDYEGNMKICCEIYPAHKLHRKRGLIGNLRRESFNELWFSDKYNYLRACFILKNTENKLCLKCLKNNENIHKIKLSKWKNYLNEKSIIKDKVINAKTNRS